MENNNKPKVNEDPNVKLIRELRAENERLRNSNENNTNLLLLTDSYKVCKNIVINEPTFFSYKILYLIFEILFYR